MKKIKNLLFASFVFIAFNINAQSIIINGDFENWTSGSPDNWTTIEAGIDVSQETAIVHGGSSAMKVKLTTTSQGNTDFRQNVDVDAGATYDISLWVYQLDTTSRVTIFVDGIWTSVYSDEFVLNTWQEITYQYTATTSANIEVGLRFYDNAGFGTGMDAKDSRGLR
jgi:hypothetical protein